MTYSAVAKNTKTDFIVFHTISFRVVLFAQVSPIGSLAKKTATAVGMVNSYENQISISLSKTV
jgi:hypothetical protein